MSHSNEDKKECEGCYARDTCDFNTSYIDPETNETIECPCIICLIKMICDYGSACEEYQRYNDIMHEMKKGNNYVP